MRGARLKDVADQAGCSESLVSKIENNKLEPSLQVLGRLCAVLKIGLGDLFTQQGDGPATEDGDIIGPAIAAEEVFGATALTPSTAPTIEGLAALEPSTLALMHGPAWRGDGAGALRELAAFYADRLAGLTA